MLYYEKQKGNMCRLHACNAYFQCNKISIQKYEEYCKEYDAKIKRENPLIYKDMSCKSWDFVYFGQETFISFIMKKYGVYLRYIPLGHMSDFSIDCLKGNYFFIFNEGHVYGYYKLKSWYKIDSLNGVNNASIDRLKNNKKIGALIPVDAFKEFKLHKGMLSNIIGDTTNIPNYIKSLNGDLNPVEKHLFIIYDILQMKKTKHVKFQNIIKHINIYKSLINNYNNKKSEFFIPLLEFLF